MHHDPNTSLFGGEATTQTAQELVAAWRGLLPGFDTTQHLTGPILVEPRGESAGARCAVTGTHVLADQVWVVGGHYDLELKKTGGRWRISSITLQTAFQQGDRNLPAKAQARVAATKNTP